MEIYYKNYLKIWFFILLILFSGPADAVQIRKKLIYTIETHSARSMKELNEKILQFSAYKDLWIRYDKKQKHYSLMIGVFQREKEAQYLLNRLKKIYSAGKIIKSSFPNFFYWVPNTARIKLSDIGFSDPIHAQGFQSYASIQFPWADSMITKNGKIKLFLKISPLLNERSSIKVLVEKIPFFNQRIQQLGINSTKLL